MKIVRDVFERPFDGEDDPRLQLARVLTRREAEAVLEYRGDLVVTLSPAPPITAGNGSGEGWDWLAGRINLELAYDWPDEEDPGVWQVHRVSGGRNDREWELVGSGETPLEAVEAAQAALAQPDPLTVPDSAANADTVEGGGE